jgi:hypothetical protein
VSRATGRRRGTRLVAVLAIAALPLGAAACDDGEVDDAGVGPGAETGTDLGDEEMGDPATGGDVGDPADPGSELEGTEG